MNILDNYFDKIDKKSSADQIKSIKTLKTIRNLNIFVSNFTVISGLYLASYDIKSNDILPNILLYTLGGLTFSLSFFSINTAMKTNCKIHKINDKFQLNNKDKIKSKKKVKTI